MIIVRTMIKKAYLKPAMTVSIFDQNELLLVASIKTEGLGDNEALTEDETPGDSWGDGM